MGEPQYQDALRALGPELAHGVLSAQLRSRKGQERHSAAVLQELAAQEAELQAAARYETEEERDPRNLRVVFKVVGEVLTTYASQVRRSLRRSTRTKPRAKA